MSFSRIDDRSGVSVKLTNSDTTVAMTITPANGAIRRPTTDFMRATGTNTTTFVSADAATATSTSSAPFAAASAGGSPSCRFLMMFSITTTEFATRMPAEHPIDTSVIVSNG